MNQSEAIREVQTLLASGKQALHAGNLFDARKQFRLATEQDPANADAWVCLADAVLPYKDKQTYLQQALALDAHHATAHERLREVEEQLAAGEVFAPKPPVAPTAHDVSSSLAPPHHTTPQNNEAQEDTTVLTTCYRHPERETGLHCTQCNNPICAECTHPTSVGQLCPTCMKERRPPNYQLSFADSIKAALISLAMSFFLSILVVWVVGQTFFGFFIALFVGSLVARLLIRLLDYATRAKRGKTMQLVVGISFVVGALPLLFVSLIFGSLTSLILLVFVVTTMTTSMYQLR